ncbi:3-hydroxyisobutyrate dehydrogenase [Aestuariivirga sp. YIM B02566]|uniref:3-hydroxyisobutyrate dehydrogenase n=1 Tax=Taklimakanibacter albus TaxID=2800327 RepID=A0ACC5R6W5_9HYPH|nr:3-hydroxyisobutyrate dehydrogenase [Aestuariivirga sp. YIM B02566]MBK1868350.1 3-hydroxyisobutyrate dehydrogenase [Aestuariivirga sp. YIM B02566]
MRIAFIGLGNMGGPMAANLAAKGFAVKGFDIVAANLDKVAEQGVVAARSAVSAVKDAEVVITMVPAGQHVLDLYRAILLPAPRGALFIDCSTIDVASAREAHAMAKGAGMQSLDAPVSGGTAGAAAATLTFMAGGDAEAFERGNPVLAAMGKRIVHCGGPGAGQAAKICNNMILGISMIAVSEAFVLAEKLGLEAQALYDVASAASGQCWSLTTYCPVPGVGPASPADNGYKPGFAAALMLKDLALAQQAAEASGAATPLGAHAEQLYREFNTAGGGEKDFSAIIRHLAAAPRS